MASLFGTRNHPNKFAVFSLSHMDAPIPDLIFFQGCPNCLGLPEEMVIVRLASGDPHHMLVLSMSSEDRDRKCWKASIDGPRVAKVLVEFSKRFPQVPILAFGASSGGALVSRLYPTYVKNLHGFVSQIMAAAAPSPNLPCAVYITMNLDEQTDALAADHVATVNYNIATITTTLLREKGAPPTTTSTRAKHIRLPPLQLYPTFFSDRIPNVSPAKSRAMFQSLSDAGWIDATTGRLTQNPRLGGWQSLVRQATAQVDDSLIPDQSPLSEVMNVAYGQHELTRDGVAEALEFCLMQEHQKASRVCVSR